MFEAYKIGVRLSLTDGVTAGLLKLSGHFKTLGRDVEAVEGKLKRLQAQGAIGLAGAGIGLGLLAALRPSIKAASEFQQQTARLNAMGFGDAVNAQALKAASGMRVMGASIIDATEAVRDALAITPHLPEALMLAPTLARVPFAAKMYGLDAGAAKGDALNMLRAAEQREGMNHPNQILHAANLFWKMSAFSGFRLKGGDFRNLSATGSTAFKLLSDTGLMNLEPALQEMGGHRTGTALMSLFTNLAMGRMLVGNGTVIQTLNNLGLIDPSRTLRNQHGKITRLMPGAVRGTDELEKDPAAWLRDYFIPTAQAHGFNTLGQQISLVSQITSNRTASTLLSLLLQNLPGLAAKTGQIGKTDTIDQAAARYGKTAAGQLAAAEKNWETAKVRFGIGVLPIATQALNKFSAVVEDLGVFMAHHQAATKAFAVGIAGLGVSLLTLGTLGAATAGFRALGLIVRPVATGIAGLTGALGGLLPLLGKAGLLGFVGYGSYKIAGSLGATSLGEWLGGHIYDWTHPDPMTQGGMRPGAGRPIHVHATLKVDGKDMARNTTIHQAHELDKPLIGPSSAVPSLAYPSPVFPAFN